MAGPYMIRHGVHDMPWSMCACCPAYRASTALQVTFQVPLDLQPYLEVLPKHGVVQGESSFAAQLKLKPLQSLLDEARKEKYYTQSDDRWRMPIHVGVANQVWWEWPINQV